MLYRLFSSVYSIVVSPLDWHLWNWKCLCVRKIMCTQMLYRTFVSNVVTKYCNKCCTNRCTYCIYCTYNVVHVSERIIVPAGHDVQCDVIEVQLEFNWARSSRVLCVPVYWEGVGQAKAEPGRYGANNNRQVGGQWLGMSGQSTGKKGVGTSVHS